MEPTKYLGRWLEMGALSMLEFLFFKKRIGSEVKFSPTFCHLQRKSSCHIKILAVFSLAILSGKYEVQESTKKLLKLSFYDYTNGKVLSVTTSLRGFLLACRFHNLKVPGWNPVGSKNLFFVIFEVFLDENLRFFACDI